MAINIEEKLYELAASQAKTQSMVELIAKKQGEIEQILNKKVAAYDAILNQGKGAYFASLALAGAIGAAVIAILKWLFFIGIK